MSSSNNQNQQSFFDPATLIAIAAVGILWIMWNSYMRAKYPPTPVSPVEVSESQDGSGVGTRGQGSQEDLVRSEDRLRNLVAEQSGTSPLNGMSVAAELSARSEGHREKQESLLYHEDDYWRFAFSSQGMGIRDLKLLQFKDREFNPITLGRGEGFLPMETNLMGRRTPIDFEVERISENEYLGRAQVGELEIVKKVVVNSESYSLHTEVRVFGQSDGFMGLTSYLSEEVEVFESTSFFLPQFERQEFFISYGGGRTERVRVDPEASLSQSFDRTNIISIGSQYFAQAVVDRSGIIPEGRVIVDQPAQTVVAVLNYPVLTRTNEFVINYTGFMGPKSYQLLESIDRNLAGVVDFGFFGFIGHYILKIMVWFHGIVGNWGLSIILLTILVRIAVLPFMIMSFRSMKAMQVIQPRLKELREKYKDDRQKLNEEMMTLMRENKVNPLGGCLPLLLQFPIFIALYQVLGQSIELYQAPFFGWIQDLSLKDPFYVLPILMGITMFFQTRLTPNTLDPAQAKVMMAMPVIFSLFMLALPSGLTLYIFVSALFGVLQQMYFMRETSKTAAVAA